MGGAGSTYSVRTIQGSNGSINVQESYGVGAFGLGIQLNATNGKLNDIRFGIDTGIELAFFGGIGLGLQMGGIYVLKK